MGAIPFRQPLGAPLRKHSQFPFGAVGLSRVRHIDPGMGAPNSNSHAEQQEPNAFICEARFIELQDYTDGYADDKMRELSLTLT